MRDRKNLAARLKLYLICGEGFTPKENIAKVSAALRGGVTAVQLRVKSWSGRECFGTALALKKLCREHGALLLINDRFDVAMAAGADGVHLGQSDLPVGAARRVAGPDFIIGGTARTPELAREAQLLGADYVGCGAAFGTATKKDALVIGPEGIKKALASIEIPSVAIGGIDSANIARLVGCGACGAALSGSLMNAEDTEKAARELLAEAERTFPRPSK